MKVREVVAGGVGGDGAAGGLTELRAGGLAELAGVGVLAIQRVDIQNLGADRKILIAHF